LLPSRFDYRTVEDMEAVMQLLMPGSHAAEAVSNAFRSAVTPWYMRMERVTYEQAEELFAVCDFSGSAVIFQPWTMGGAVEAALGSRGLVLLGHWARTSHVLAPRDLMLQPDFYRSLRNYKEAMDVIIVTAPEALLDLAIPLALCFADQAVFAWVPPAYVFRPTQQRADFWRSLDDSTSVVVISGPRNERGVWLGLFNSAAAKQRIMHNTGFTSYVDVAVLK
jgi:hypothetical protein